MWAPQNNININSNKLKRLRKIWWVIGEGYPLKTRDNGMELIRCLWSFSRGCFCTGIDLFLLLIPWLGFFGFLMETKGCLWAGGDCLDMTVFSSFIMVCGDPWGSWFWPGHSFSFWVMGLFIGVKLTMFPDNIKYCRRPNWWKKLAPWWKLCLHVSSLGCLRFAGHLCSYPPTGVIHLSRRPQYPFKK